MNAQRWLIVGRALVVLGCGMVATGVLGILLGLTATSAHAISGADRARVGSTIIPNGSVMPEYSSGSVTFQGTSATGRPEVTRIGHTWDAQPARQTQLNENYRVKVGGHDLDVVRRSVVPPAAIARAAGLALKTLPVVAVGVELWDLFDEVRVRPGTCAEGGLPSSVSDVLCFDAGVDQVSQSGTVYRGYSHQPWVSTPQAACTAAGDYYKDSSMPSYKRTDMSTSVSGTAPNITCYMNFQEATQTSMGNCGSPWGTPGYGCPVAKYNSISITTSTQSTQQCPASTDFSDPALNIPAGLPPGPDGKCRTGRYDTPKTPIQAGELLEQHAPPTGEELRRMAEDALGKDVPIEGVTPGNMSGPTSAPGTPTTTTTQNPDGTTKTTTKTPTTNYTYNGDTINYTITTVTVVNNAGDITTTTEGTTPEESDACKVAPDSLGCSKMGTPGTDQPAWQTRDVVFAPEDLGFGAGSCPAPESWDVFGITLAWGYEPVCEVAPVIRLALLAFAAIGAIGVIIKETNS